MLYQIPLSLDRKGIVMSEKCRDSKGRLLRNGEVQRQDGLYMFRYTDPNGKRKTVYSWKLVDTDKAPEGKRSVLALRDIEKQVLRDLDDGIRTGDANSITVNALFKSFMDLRVDLKETTRCNYICLYDSQVREEIGGRKIRNIRFSDIQKLYMHMIQDLGLKASTVQSVHSILYQMFESAVMDNLIRVNPTANVLKSLRKMLSVEQEKRHALTEEEQARLIEYVYRSRYYRRLGALFTVLLGTGMRIGEALGFRWCDCDFEKKLISVNHTLLYKPSEHGGYEYRISEPKTKAGLRTIPMLSDVKAVLLEERDKKHHPNIKPFSIGEYTGFIFLNNNGKVFTPAYVFDTIQHITSTYNREEYFNAEKEGREPCYLPKFSAHILRHTFCTRLCENERNLKIIQDVMGHRNIRTTMDVYNEATESKKLESFHSLDGKIKVL